MKKIQIILTCMFLTGCATSGQEYNVYVETIKSINRDITMSEIACWQQETDKTKVNCRKDAIKPEPPKPGLRLPW